MFGLGAGELLVIFVFALIFIGPKKLPELARNLGKGIREFQKAKDDLLDPNSDDDGQIEVEKAQEKVSASSNDSSQHEAKEDNPKKEEAAQVDSIKS